DQRMCGNPALRRIEMLHHRADTCASVIQPDDAISVDASIDRFDHLALFIYVLSGRIFLCFSRAMQRNDLPLVVEHRCATAAGRCVALLNKKIRTIEINDVVLSDSDLLLVALRMLNDRCEVPNTRLAEISVEDQISLAAQLISARAVGGLHSD